MLQGNPKFTDFYCPDKVFAELFLVILITHSAKITYFYLEKYYL